MAKFVTFIETEVFTKRAVRWNDDAYAALQVELARDPTKGKVIQGTGGLRKIRMAARGRGKRGGGRVIYYFVPIDEAIYMIFAYDKGEIDDLTSEQRKTLKSLAQAIAGQYRKK
jgi:hypothetical protein